ncbi:MAG: ABC transporter permease [Chthonomonadales bacterium]|nr:ABC transporter permease [Chthonomonadales bacterium]
MSRLNLKLLRDLAHARWQFLAITFVTALGVAMYHGSMVSYETQRASYELSYERLAFGDAWIPVRRAPRAVVRQIERMPNVVAVEGRTSEIVEIEQEKPRRPRVIGRIISLPSGREPAVNRLRIIEGSPLGSRSRRELLLEQAFARANNYRPGDRIYPRFAGRRVRFRVAGIVSSAEFIYPVMGNVFSLPMPELFGAMFADEQVLGPLIGLSGQITEVCLRTRPGSEASVAAAVKRRLKPYGAEEPILRAEQASNKLLQSDLEGNKPFLVIMPALFLGSAALSVALMLARWVQAQRGIVGFLRASGFPARAILFHYLGAGAAIGVAGGIAGIGMGHLIGMWFAAAYERVIRTPFAAPQNRPDLAVTAFALAMVACLLGGWLPARSAARIVPAEAMRGMAASQPRALARIRLPLFLAIAVRNMLRRPMRTLGTASGVASAVSLMIIAGTFRDSMMQAISEAMDDFQRYDITVAFVPERSANIVTAMNAWPGVRLAEGTLDIPVRAKHNGREKDTVAMGFARGTKLRVLRDMSGASIVPEPGQALYSNVLAKRILTEPGDTVRLDYSQNIRGRSASAVMKVGPRLRLMVALPIYMEMEDLRRRFARKLQMPPDAVTGAVIAVEPGYERIVTSRLHRTDGVGLALSRADVTRQIDEVTAFANTFIAFMYLLGSAMAFAIVYTVTDIVLWERTRELATLRTLGYGMGSVLRLVTIENIMMGLLGSALAMYPAYLLARFMLEAANTEGFTMLMVTSPTTYALSVASTLVAVLAAQWPGLRRIRRLDLADAIRTRE